MTLAGRWAAAIVALGLAWAAAAAAGSARAAGKPYRLPSVDLKQRIIWGAECEGPDGTGLAFGGVDQEADGGRPHTRIREGGQWKPVGEELRAANPLQPLRDRAWEIRCRQKDVAARARSVYFSGLPAADEQARLTADVVPAQQKVAKDVRALVTELEGLRDLGAYEAGRRQAALGSAAAAAERVGRLLEGLRAGVTPEAVKAMAETQVDLETAAEWLDAEPPPRALSPLVYEPKTGLYVLFGGDHLDFLTNDTWVFDPKARRWMQRRPDGAPPPRASHTLRAAGDGKVVLSGGYTYASNTDYCGGQYVDRDDGPWTYDVAADTWAGPGATVRGSPRVYRSGPFHPDLYLEAPKPDAASGEARLKALPINTWVPLDPPQTPRLNRDWGTVTLDPDRDQILVWSGGHSAHGGTDVLHYHLATNRWELPHPVEFPLGQLYANTDYPEGVSFNRRPWITGHTYQNYAYDPLTRKMLFVGQPRWFYLYDPDVADWAGRGPKPPGMIYGGCFYDLTLAATPRGVICWGKGPKVHRFDPQEQAWKELAVEGALPEPAVDYSTMVYDSRRDRLLLFRTGYGKPYDGQVHALDPKALTVRALAPGNMAAAEAAGFMIDRACYDPAADLVLFGSLLAPGADGRRRTAAYDAAGNRWVSVRVGYEVRDKDKPDVPSVRGRSAGLVYDARRRLIWGVDTNRVRVYVLRFDAAGADVAPLR